MEFTEKEKELLLTILDYYVLELDELIPGSDDKDKAELEKNKKEVQALIDKIA